MNVEVSLERLTRLVEEARAMPLSASCVVNRTEVLELLDEIRAGLPSEITQASALLEDRESVLEAARGPRLNIDIRLSSRPEGHSAGGDVERQGLSELL